MLSDGRYGVGVTPQLAAGWTCERVTSPSRLYGANGLRTGPDGRIYVAQVTGSQISALDLQSGQLDVVSAKGGAIVAPDDMAFDQAGNLYATEVMDGRVSMRSPAGRSRVLAAGLPCANGITVHQGRLFVNECRMGGRLLELSLEGGEPRLILDNLPMPNAMEVGPDGYLYFPLLANHEIWRVHPDGGLAERVVDGLCMPDALKFDHQGQIVTTQLATGDVVRIDPRTGERKSLATLEPGLDNLTFVGERLFVSSLCGEITEICTDGKTRPLVQGGFNWPLDLAVGSAGALFIADGTYLHTWSPASGLRVLSMMMHPGYPAWVRGLVATGPGEFLVTNSNGQVCKYEPALQRSDVWSEGHDQLYGIVAHGKSALVAEYGAGCVLAVQPGGVRAAVVARDLQGPTGLALVADGSCLVAESDAGRVVRVELEGSGRKETIVDGLESPQGLVVRAGKLYIVDGGAKAVLCHDLGGKGVQCLARGLPIGAPPGVVPQPLQGMPPFSGPQGPFAGIAAGQDGTLFVSCDGEGSVVALKPPTQDTGS